MSGRPSPSESGVQSGPVNLLVAAVLAAAVFAPLSAWFAMRRARDPVTWLLLGAVIGPIALALLALAPPGRCPWCAATVEGWPSTCRRCGRTLAATDPVLAEPSGTPALEEKIPAESEGPVRSGSPQGPPRRSAYAQPSVRWPIPATTGSGLDPGTGEILSIGVFISGNAGLEIGARYGLSRVAGPDGDRLRVFGPVDIGEITIRHEGPIDAFDVTGMADRVIIAGRDKRSSLTFVFRTLGGMRGEDLERALGEGPVSG